MHLRRVKWGRHITLVGDKRNANRILVVKREGKRTLGRYRGLWADSIKEMDWACADWILGASGQDN
jgi:hypothetical protein